MADFSAESTEWWKASLQEGRPIKSAFEGELSNSSAVLEMNSSVCENMVLGSAHSRVDTESLALHGTNPFNDNHQSPFLDDNRESAHEQLWNIQQGSQTQKR